MAKELLRRADQAVIAALTAVAIAGALVAWLAEGGATGGLVDIDGAAPLDYRFLVDANSADWPELAQLPGIGPTLARRIVASRTTGGPYRSIEDLRRVDGIGPRKLDAMRPYLLPIAGDTQIVGADADAEAHGSSG